jgi:hypothetical protein
MNDVTVSRLHRKSVFIRGRRWGLQYQECFCDYFKYNGQALDNEQTNQYILDDGPNVIGNYRRVGAKQCKSQTHGIKNECGENCAAPDETPKLQQRC